MAWMAKAGNPDAVLYVNDYGIFYDYGFNLQSYIMQIRNLLANGVPIGGIGVQGHSAGLHQPGLSAEHVQDALDRLSVFGIGADLDDTAWRAVFRQLVALGYVRVAHEAHGALALTDASRPVLKGEAQIAMRRHVERPGRTAKAKARAAATADLSPADRALFERLKAWRLGEARAQGVPAYVILHDRTLAGIAQARPASLAALGAVGGIGASRLERYGQALLAVVAAS